MIDVVPLEAARQESRRLAIGKFDGLHLGHRGVIRGAETVVTFDRHPLALLAPERAPRTLATIPRRAALAARLGVREVVVLPFDQTLATMPAARFIDEVLAGALAAKEVSVGANFRFGHRAAGDTELLSADARFTTRIAPLVELHGRRVSSTWIRELVEAGDLAGAARLLGGPFALSATLIGSSPAQAEMPADHVRPPAGRYLGRVIADGSFIATTARVAAGDEVVELRPEAPIRAPLGSLLQVELLRRMAIPRAAGVAREPAGSRAR